MENQGGNVYLFEVLGLIRLREGLYAIVGSNDRRLHPLIEKRIAHAFRGLRVWLVVAIEREAQIPEELCTVAGNTRSNVVEHRNWQPSRIFVALDHDRRNRPDEYRLLDALVAVTADVAGYFTAACRMADHCDIREVEFVEQLGEIVRIGI